MNNGLSCYALRKQLYVKCVFFTLYTLCSCFEGELKQELGRLAKELEEACSTAIHDDVKTAHNNLIDSMNNMGILHKIAEFDAQATSSSMFNVFRQYMTMVLKMMMFNRAVRTTDWDLHVQALEKFTKYFFAHDRLNYARVIPVYLAQMKSLQTSDPDTYREFQDGNWVVNKNTITPLCAIGADHGLEHVNRSMKVNGGLIGITQNEAARTKFFLIAPELARLAQEAKDMAGVSGKLQSRTTASLRLCCHVKRTT